jgi:hypothetical protein
MKVEDFVKEMLPSIAWP